MSHQDLITGWVEAVARAASLPAQRDSLSKEDLEVAPGMAVRSDVRGAHDPSTNTPICQTFALFC